MSNGTGVKINLNNEKVIECTVKSLDLSRLLKAHERTSGNDYLYEFCRAHPIPKEIPDPQGNHSEKASDDLTPEEACLADQMWLIGRSYAASSQRYAYAGTKPKEKYLGSEGYESFFQDIARMFLRDECHEKGNPIAYLRGAKCKLEKCFIDKTCFDGLDEDEEKSFEELQRSLEELNNKAKDACSTLEIFQDLRKRLNEIKKSHYKFTSAESSDETEGFNGDWSLAGTTSTLVVDFAIQLNAARVLRDTAIIFRSLETPLATLREKKGKAKNPFEDLAAWAGSICSNPPSVSISFCSKFLHFHYPQLFFIYDSISSKRAKAGNLSENYFGFRLQKNIKKDGSDAKQPSRVIKEWIGANPKSGSKNNDESAKPDEKHDKWIKENLIPDSENNDESAKIKEKYDKKLTEYQEHVFNELVIAYAVYRYLDESKEDSKEQQEAKNKLRKYLRACTNDQDDSYEKSCIPPRYLSITRLVDELVTNSSPENLEEAKEID